MDRRNPDCRDANNLCHPWSLGSGDPCRNDEFFLNLMAVTLKRVNVNFGTPATQTRWSGTKRVPTLERGNQNKINARGYGHDHSRLRTVR